MHDIHDVFARLFPGRSVDRVRRLGAGEDHVAYDVDGDLVVRLRRDDPGAVTREAALLRLVGSVSPVPVPEPVLVDADHGCLAYRRLPGTPLIDLPTPDPALVAAVATQLGDLLAALHAVPARAVSSLVDTDATAPQQWLDEAVAQWPETADVVPPEFRTSVTAFLAAAAPPPADHLVFSHQDLGIEHVLTDPGTATVTGVIDWSDAAVSDPARDIALIHRDLGAAAARVALLRTAAAHGGRRDDGGTGDGCGTVPADAGLRRRVVFYARCGLLADLAYGLRAGRPEYTAKSVRGLPALFGAAGSAAGS